MRAADPHTKKPRCGGAKSGLIEGLPMRATANPPIQYYSWLHAAQETRTATQNRRFETPLLHMYEVIIVQADQQPPRISTVALFCFSSPNLNWCSCTEPPMPPLMTTCGDLTVGP
jgi:hypothetical protein